MGHWIVFLEYSLGTKLKELLVIFILNELNQLLIFKQLINLGLHAVFPRFDVESAWIVGGEILLVLDADAFQAFH